jgi:hypothetical protein
MTKAQKVELRLHVLRIMDFVENPEELVFWMRELERWVGRQITEEVERTLFEYMKIKTNQQDNKN